MAARRQRAVANPSVSDGQYERCLRDASGDDVWSLLTVGSPTKLHLVKPVHVIRLAKLCDLLVGVGLTNLVFYPAKMELAIRRFRFRTLQFGLFIFLYFM